MHFKTLIDRYKQITAVLVHFKTLKEYRLALY